MPDPVQKYFTACSVPGQDEVGFRALTVLRLQRGGQAAAGALWAPGWGRREGHILCIPWGLKQLLLWVKEVKESRDDPSGPPPTSARALYPLASVLGPDQSTAPASG